MHCDAIVTPPRLSQDQVDHLNLLDHMTRLYRDQVDQLNKVDTMHTTEQMTCTASSNKRPRSPRNAASVSARSKAYRPDIPLGQIAPPAPEYMCAVKSTSAPKIRLTVDGKKIECVTQCVTPRLRKTINTPCEIPTAVTDAAGFMVPCMGYISLCGFTYPVTYLRFFFLNGVWSHVLRMFLNQSCHMSHHLLADVAHIYVQVKDVLPRPRTRKAQSGGRRATNLACGVYISKDLTRAQFGTSLPPCIQSPRDHASHVTWVNEYLQDKVQEDRYNPFIHSVRGLNLPSFPALFDRMPPATLEQFNRGKDRSGTVFYRSDYTKHAHATNPCLVPACLCHPLVAQVRALDMKTMTARQVMDLIISQIPSSMELVARTELHQYFKRASDSIPADVCYLPDGDRPFESYEQYFDDLD